MGGGGCFPQQVVQMFQSSNGAQQNKLTELSPVLSLASSRRKVVCPLLSKLHNCSIFKRQDPEEAGYQPLT